MVNIIGNGKSLSILFKDNDKYLFNGLIEVAINELIVIVDTSNAVTFKRASNGDVLFSQDIRNVKINGKATSKETIIDDFAKIGYGGAGGDLPIASDSVLGGIRVGAGLSINPDTGTLSVTGGGVADAVEWNNVLNKPKSFAPSAHTHPMDQVDGLSAALSGKANTSDIPDISNFITSSVDNLTNYYKKSETYTLTEVNDLIGTISTLKFKKVTIKPEKGETNIIYLVPKAKAEVDNIYEEWIYVDNKWELIGTTKIDLSGYATETWVTSQIKDKANKSDIPTKTSELTNDSNFLTEHQSLAGYATELWVESKKYLTTVPDNYATDEEVTQAVANKADRSELPTKLSQLTGDTLHRTVSDAEKETWNNKQPAGDYITKGEVISDLFDATELFTKSQEGGAITSKFRGDLDQAIADKKVLYVNDDVNNVFAVITFIGKGNSIYSFLAVSADISYSLNLNINDNTVTIKLAPKGYGFNKYETEYPVSVFELSAESTNNDILRAFSSNDNGVVIPSAGDVFEVKEPGAVSGMIIKDSGIVTSRVETNGKIDLVLMSNNLVDDYVTIHTIKLSYNAAQGPDSLAVDKVIHSVMDPSLLTQERQATLVTRSELPKMVTLTQSEYDLLPTKDASTYYFIKEA